MTTVLFVCTGNTCRSPMAEALAVHRLQPRVADLAVGSAGLLRAGAPASPGACAVMARRGLDLSAHRSRSLGDALVPAPDLIVAMAREHARAVVETDPALFPRTFTLKDLVARAWREGPRRPAETLAGYLRRVGAHRSFASLAGASVADDVADPIGKDEATFERTAAIIEPLLDDLAGLLWP